MRFIVDVMLGSLAKWLRILGYDTIYDAHFSDDELFFKAHQEKRILLTRDTELASRMKKEYCLYITGTKLRQQLLQVVSTFNLNNQDFIFTRCVKCNANIAPIDKKAVKHKVPDYIFQTNDTFYFCHHCDKIYWQGSHITHVKNFLSELEQEQ